MLAVMADVALFHAFTLYTTL